MAFKWPHRLQPNAVPKTYAELQQRTRFRSASRQSGIQGQTGPNSSAGGLNSLDGMKAWSSEALGSVEAISLGRSGSSAGCGFEDRLIGSSRRVLASLMEKIMVRAVKARMMKGKTVAAES